MQPNEKKRLKPSLLETDKKCVDALKNVAGYSPVNPTYTVEALVAAVDALAKAQTEETKAVAAASIARQNAAAKEWEFHSLVLGAKDQVLAQFGRDSDEAELVGLKKKSDYKVRGRKPVAESNTSAHGQR